MCFKGGLTNLSYIIERNNNSYVQKKSISHFEPFLKLQNLEKMLNHHHDIFSPESKYIKNGTLFFESLYLKGYITFDKISLKDDRLKAINLIAKKIIDIHSLKTIGLSVFNFEDELSKFYYLNKLSIQKKYREFFQMGKRVVAENNQIFNNNNSVNCHNDLVEGNFLFSKDLTHVYIIDFDGCSENTPLFDIVSFMYENDLSDYERNLFLEKTNSKYLFTSFEINKMRLYQDILWFFWAEYCFSKTKNLAYKKISEIKFERIKI